MGAQERCRGSTNERRGLRPEPERPRNNEQGDPTPRLATGRTDLLQQRRYGVGGELRPMKGSRWKTAEGFRERVRGYDAGVGDRAIDELLRQRGSAGNGSGAAAAQKTCFRDTVVHNASGEL